VYITYTVFEKCVVLKMSRMVS